MSQNKFSRRSLIVNSLKAGGLLGLKSLLIGLPPSFILNRTWAQTNPNARFLIFAENADGDPLNINCPGSYTGNSKIWRASDADFSAPPTYLFGTQNHRAAAPWGGLPADLRSRLNFFHHRTGSSNHPEAEQVMTIYGSLTGLSGAGSENVPSAAAQELASQLNTIQKEPINLEGHLSYNGLSLARIEPPHLKSLLGSNTNSSVHAAMANLRETELDKIYRDLKSSGTPAQKLFLEEFATSREQAKQLGSSLVEYLSDVQYSTEVDNIKTAAALIAIKACPVVRLKIHFGGDNHFDAKLEDEVSGTRSGIASIGLLWDELKKYNIQNTTSFSMINVFGRTFHMHSGRGHYGYHNVMVSFGDKIQGGVIGALDSDLRATGINSTTGTSVSPDINPDLTHHAAVRSLYKALGISDNRSNIRVPGGKIVQAYLK